MLWIQICPVWGYNWMNQYLTMLTKRIYVSKEYTSSMDLMGAMGAMHHKILHDENSYLKKLSLSSHPWWTGKQYFQAICANQSVAMSANNTHDINIGLYSTRIDTNARHSGWDVYIYTHIYAKFNVIQILGNLTNINAWDNHVYLKIPNKCNLTFCSSDNGAEHT